MAIEEFGFSLLERQQGLADEERRRQKRAFKKQQKADKLFALGKFSLGIANQALKNKAESFFTTEEYLRKKRNQERVHGLAAEVLEERQKAELHEGGIDDYYIDRSYNNLLDSYKKANPDQDDIDKDGRNGFLWQTASDRYYARKDQIQAEYESASKVKSVEDWENIYQANKGPTTLRGLLGEKIIGIFSDNPATIREQRIEALENTSRANREDFKAARNILDDNAPVHEIKKLAEHIQKQFTIDVSDWDVTESPHRRTVTLANGSKVDVSLVRTTRTHPNNPNRQKVTEVGTTERDRKLLQGTYSYQETYEYTDPLTGGSDTATRTVYFENGVQVHKKVEAAQAKPDKRVGRTATDPNVRKLAQSSMVAIGQSNEEQDIYQAFMDNNPRLKDDKEAFKDYQINTVHKIGESVLDLARRSNENMSDEKAYRLGALILNQHILSHTDGEGSYGEIHNGFNTELFRKSPQLFILDATWADHRGLSSWYTKGVVEETSADKPMVDAYRAGLEAAFEEFSNLDKGHQDNMIRSLEESQQGNKKILIDGISFTAMLRLQQKGLNFGEAKEDLAENPIVAEEEKQRLSSSDLHAIGQGRSFDAKADTQGFREPSQGARLAFKGDTVYRHTSQAIPDDTEFEEPSQGARLAFKGDTVYDHTSQAIPDDTEVEEPSQGLRGSLMGDPKYDHKGESIAVRDFEQEKANKRLLTEARQFSLMKDHREAVEDAQVEAIEAAQILAEEADVDSKVRKEMKKYFTTSANIEALALAIKQLGLDPSRQDLLKIIGSSAATKVMKILEV